MPKKKSKYTRTGARRAGDDYQDVVALEVLVSFLEHPDRYRWVCVEADNAGFLDDVVVLKEDDTLEIKQVKYSTDPESKINDLNWDKLLEQKTGKKGKLLDSLLQKWFSSLETVRKQGKNYEASLVTNWKPEKQIKAIMSAECLINFDKIDSKIRKKIIKQLGDEYKVRKFFAEFHFYTDRPSLGELNNSVWRRFKELGGKPEGWLNLKETLRSWVINRNLPPPNGEITLEIIRISAKWYQLRSLPQEFEIPEDYVLPNRDFHKNFVTELNELHQGCVMLTGSPGVGKSTYLSYLFGQLVERNIPAIRHHYFLSLADRTVGRLDHQRVAASLMSNIQKSFPEALGELEKENPDPSELSTWIKACSQHFKKQGKTLIIIIDGLDHVWREKRSIEELNKLFEHILPLPDGITILLGTQPLDDTLLPLGLTRSEIIKKELPLLDLTAVKQWLQYHEKNLDLPENAHIHDSYLDRLAVAFYEKSQGQPLHLKYTIKALLEQDIPVTEENVKRLPGCPHQDIIEYYKELWVSLPEEGREILYLFAACNFSWPLHGISECLDPQRSRLVQINSALKQVKHLTINTPMGLSSFHNSLIVFIQDQSDYLELYSRRSRELALNWLEKSAPEYWKWAFEWLLKAELGNDQPLLDGPSRQWVIEAIAKRFPRRKTSNILEHSSKCALKRENLPRFIEVGFLLDYFNHAYEYRAEILDTLLYSQLIIEEDRYLQRRLYANISNLSETELVLLSENGECYGNEAVIDICFDELNKRLEGVRTGSKREIWDNEQSQVEALLKVAALKEDIDPQRVVDFAMKNRQNDLSYDILETYTEALRISRKTQSFRKMLKIKMSLPERSIVLRHAVLLAIEEGFDLAHEVIVANNASNPFAVIYAVLNEVANFEFRRIQFPDIELLSLKVYEFYGHRKKMEDFFYITFFCFLANHLFKQGEQNEEWLQKVGDYSWPKTFLHKLNTIAAQLAQLFLSNSLPSFSWIYKQIKEFQRLNFFEDRISYEIGLCAERAINQISLDILILNKALGKTCEINKNDLKIALTSGYFHPWQGMEIYVTRRRKWLNKEAVKWLLQEQAKQLDFSIEYFSERIHHYSILTSLASLHNLKTESKIYVLEAAKNSISYGEHKDILLYEAFEIIKACHEANLPEARQWLLKLAPAIAGVRDFTDGDETRHLPRELADMLAKITPEFLSAYQQWLCQEEEYSDALAAFHSFLRTADFSAEINQALARTAVDDESLKILVKKAEKDDQGAKKVLSSLTELLGKSALNRKNQIEHKEVVESEYNSNEEFVISPADFPPGHLMGFITSANAKKIHQREKCVDHWFEFWKSKGREEEAFRDIEINVNRGIDLGNYDVLFNSALSLYGKEHAYPWLVKAHLKHYGWISLYTDKKKSIRQWEIVKKHYPDRWFKFIQDTITPLYNEPWHYQKITWCFVRLVEYCLFMEKTELAKKISEQVIESTLELVSPLKLPIPGWVKEI